MNRATESAPSVQRRLLWFLLPPLAVLMLAGVYANYRAATAFVESAYDQRLGDAAMSLAGSLIKDGRRLRVDPNVVPAAAHRADHIVSLRYAILDASGELLAGTREVPAAAASMTANPTFADAIVNGERLRIASYRVSFNRDTAVISVAESAAQRAVPGRFILASTWLMDFIQLDVTLLIVWLGVHFALKPLLSLRRQIEAGSPRELNHLDATTVPAEVKPLVEALNLLFDVLAEAARSQRRFVADTAHQLRTPITGLFGNLELLMKEPGAAALRPRLQGLHTGMENLARSANQLLALARADPVDQLRRTVRHGGPAGPGGAVGGKQRGSCPARRIGSGAGGHAGGGARQCPSARGSVGQPGRQRHPLHAGRRSCDGARPACVMGDHSWRSRTMARGSRKISAAGSGSAFTVFPERSAMAAAWGWPLCRRLPRRMARSSCSKRVPPGAAPGPGSCSSHGSAPPKCDAVISLRG